MKVYKKDKEWSGSCGACTYHEAQRDEDPDITIIEIGMMEVRVCSRHMEELIKKLKEML